ncbi:MAG: HTH domain-containing protein [Cytophagales bacterium]|nr:MAG: HTH domain-containing protein [Cytophagales bacterium]
MPLQTFPQTLALIGRIDYLIRTRATGTPEQMAERLGVSRSTWFNYVAVLKTDMNFPIEYDRQAQTYYYTRPGAFRMGYVVTEPDVAMPTI